MDKRENQLGFPLKEAKLKHHLMHANQTGSCLVRRLNDDALRSNLSLPTRQSE